MFRVWKYTLFFLLCLVVALLFNLPIAQVLPYVKLPGSVQVSGVDGNVLKGSAAEVSVNDFPIRGIRYSYQPSCIPLLKVCYRIDYDQYRIPGFEFNGLRAQCAGQAGRAAAVAAR